MIDDQVDIAVVVEIAMRDSSADMIFVEVVTGRAGGKLEALASSGCDE